MEIANIPVKSHIKLQFTEFTTHVFTFSEIVDMAAIEKHPAVAALISRKAYSNYMITKSSCPKTISIRIMNN